MRNLRRRKEIIVLGVLFGSTVKVVNQEKYRDLQKSGPLTYLKPLDDMFAKAVPIDSERERELNTYKLVVNAILPPNHFSSPDEAKLWFACHVVHLLVSSGWILPTHPVMSGFVQSAFDMSAQLSVTLPDGWQEHAAKVPALFKRMGYFG